MQPIIIGAGRGKRLGFMTEDQPKCYVQIGGRRIIDWTLDAFDKVELKTPVFIGGYQIDRIREDHPQLTFCHNRDWKTNNILASLMHAEDHMAKGFICAYSDILFRETVVRDVIKHPGDIVLCVDTRWRERYARRSEHPEDDAEKVVADGDHVMRIGRDIKAESADGEYIGVACMSATGASLFIEQYHRVAELFSGKPWRGSEVFEKAYLILLFQEMIEQGIEIRMAPTDGRYMEIYTEEDLQIANEVWIQGFTRP